MKEDDNERYEDEDEEEESTEDIEDRMAEAIRQLTAERTITVRIKILSIEKAKPPVFWDEE